MSTRICPTGAVEHRRWWDYRIYYDDGMYYAEPGTVDTGLPVDLDDIENANAMILLQAAYDALPSQTGGKIYIDGDLTFLGDLELEGRRKMICRNSPFKSQALGVAYIQGLHIHSDTGVISDHYFEGLQFRQHHFYADGGNPIRNMVWDKCKLSTAATAGNQGILVDSDGESGEYIDGIIYAELQAIMANNAANMGSLMTVRGGNSGVGNSLWHFWNGRLTATTASRVIHIADGGYLDRVLIDGQTSFEPSTGAQVLYYVETQTDSGCGGGLTVADCTVEFNQNATLFQMPGVSASALRLQVDFHDNIMGFSAGDTLTIANNLNTNWIAAAGRNGLTFKDNRMSNTGGAMARGTPGANADFPVAFLDNPGYNPVGNIATPFPAGAGFLLDVAAAQAFPSAATLYTVMESPKEIFISGGTVTAIAIDGVVSGLTSGTFYLKPEQTIEVGWSVQPLGVVSAC